MKLENGKYVGGLSTRGSIVIARLGRSLIATFTFVTLIVIAATIGFVALVLNSVGTAAADEFYPPFNIQATGHYGACFSVTWQAEPTGVTSFSVERKEPFQRWEVPADQHDVWACGMEPGNWYDFEICSWYGTPEGDTACAEARLQLIQTGNIDPSGRPPQPRIVETHFGETFIGVKWDAAGFEYDSYFVNYTLKGHGPNTIHHDDDGTWGYQLIEGLLPSRTYVLQVQGCTETFFGIGSDNCWDWSPPVEVTTAAPPPPADGGPQLPSYVASFESLNYPGHLMRHRNALGELTPVVSDLDRADATFIVRVGLSGAPDSVSFESVNFPGHFLRHNFSRLKLHANDGSDLFLQDATFMRRPAGCRGVYCQVRFESVNYPGHFLRHSNFELWLAQDDSSELFKQDSTWRRLPPPFNHVPPGAVSFESFNYPGHFLRHRNSLGELTPVVSDLDRADATFIVRAGLNGSPIGVSLESVNYPGHFLRHQDYRLKLHLNDGSDLFHQDATFYYQDGSCGEGNCPVSFESVNFPGHFIRHTNFELWLAQNDGSELFANDAVWQPVPPR